MTFRFEQNEKLNISVIEAWVNYNRKIELRNKQNVTVWFHVHTLNLAMGNGGGGGPLGKGRGLMETIPYFSTHPLDRCIEATCSERGQAGLDYNEHCHFVYCLDHTLSVYFGTATSHPVPQKVHGMENELKMSKMLILWN